LSKISGNFPCFAELGCQRCVLFRLRARGEVVREELQPRGHRGVERERGALIESGHGLRHREHAGVVEALEHRGAGGAGPGDEQQVGFRILDLLRERREVVGGKRREQSVDGGALGAQHRAHGGDVGLAEGRVLREHQHVLAAQ
jgi:hypothetical protein